MLDLKGHFVTKFRFLKIKIYIKIIYFNFCYGPSKGILRKTAWTKANSCASAGKSVFMFFMYLLIFV